MDKDKKTIILNRVFYFILFFAIISSAFLTYTRIVVNKDYQISAEVSCDPTLEQCFEWKCDPVEDSTCPENPDERISYYKIISKRASNIAQCESTIEKNGCNEELSCVEGETSCFYIYNYNSK